MPLTLFHIGPSALLSLATRRRLDFMVLILSNFLIDLEPLIIFLFHINTPLRGYAHTILFGGILGAGFGALSFWGKNIIAWLTHSIGLEYAPRLKPMMQAGVAGIWLHIIIDSLVHADMQPFFPFLGNPLYQIISPLELTFLIIISFLAAGILFTKDLMRRFTK